MAKRFSAQGESLLNQSEFDEAAYLQANPDVALAVEAGAFSSGWQHFRSYGQSEGRSLSAPELPRETLAPVSSNDESRETAPQWLGFELRAPSAQTAIDIFRGRWASDLSNILGVSGTGSVPLFEQDDRPAQAARLLGRNGRFDGTDILELGPLEGGHTYQLEQLGSASVTAVEANTEAFLKCLVVKEICQLRRSHFLLGDIVEYLEATSHRFDVVFCSGVLYHMPDPLRLIQNIARVTDRCFIWTHYYAADMHNLNHEPRERTLNGFSATYWSHTYGDKAKAFWGGNQQTAAWLERASLLDAFRHVGLAKIDVVRDDLKFKNGPNIAFCASRSV